MKPQEIKDLYPVPPDVHESLCRTLSDLDAAVQIRYQKRRKVRRFFVAFAAIAVLAAFTTAAYATDLFGLSTERVGKYGLNMNIEEDAERFNGEKKHVKMKLGYIPEGYSIIYDEGSEIGLASGLDDNTDADEIKSFVLLVTDAEYFDGEMHYIVESEEMVCNGHRTVIAAQQPIEDEEKYYFVTEYFENWGYVVTCYGSSRDEMIKIMQHLDLTEDVNYTEPSIHFEMSSGDEDRDPVDDYTFSNSEKYRFCGVGDSFDYTDYSVVRKGETQEPKFNIKVRAAEERDSFDGLDQNAFFNTFENYFDNNNRLIAEYVRDDYDIGDGIDQLNKHTKTKTTRHFILLTLDVTVKADSDQEEINLLEENPLNYATWAITKQPDGSYAFSDTFARVNLVYDKGCDDADVWKKGETHTVILGVMVDDEILDNSYLYFDSRLNTIDDDAETLERVEEYICIALKGAVKK